MSDSEPHFDAHFMTLVMSLQGSAMLQMGKVASPVTGEIDRNLEAAQASIDMLAMLQKKTAGNLEKQEIEYLEHVLYELRLNYVDESKKPDTPKSDSGDKAEAADKVESTPSEGDADKSTSTD